LSRLTCAQAFERLDSYVDRELSPEELEEVEAHLSVCAQCASEFATEAELLERLKQAVRRLRAPQALMARIAARIREIA
jgi:mycothiol system anti-sigma-R factor